MLIEDYACPVSLKKSLIRSCHSVWSSHINLRHSQLTSHFLMNTVHFVFHQLIKLITNLINAV